MAARTPSSSSSSSSSSLYKLRSLVTMLCRCRVASSGGSWRQPYKLGRVGSFDRGLRFLSVSSSKHNQPKLEKENSDSHEVVTPPLPDPPKFGISNWMKLYLGSILSLLLPLWMNKRDSMLILEGKAEKIAEEVEVAAVVVEKVATTADKVFSEVAKHLPDDSKLKGAAEAMEIVSSLAAHDAQLVEDIIHKVGDVKQDLEELDTKVERVIKGNHPKPN